jgi:hypothetical protein
MAASAAAGEDGNTRRQVCSWHATTTLAMAGRAHESGQSWYLLQRRELAWGTLERNDDLVIWGCRGRHCTGSVAGRCGRSSCRSSGLQAVPCGSLGVTRGPRVFMLLPRWFRARIKVCHASFPKQVSSYSVCNGCKFVLINILINFKGGVKSLRYYKFTGGCIEGLTI